MTRGRVTARPSATSLRALPGVAQTRFARLLDDPVMDQDRLLARLDAVIAKGVAVQALPSDHQPMIRQHDNLVLGTYGEWRAQAIALVRGALPDNHHYRLELEMVTQPETFNIPDTGNRDAGVGVLRAFREDLANGDLAGIRTLVSAEVFTDFMGMADHLLAEGYHHAAASIAGAVLEDSLRRTLLERGAKATGNLESMNQVALDTGLYGPPVYQQVKVWVGVRNDADHGNWSAVGPDRVSPMVRDLPTFLVQQLGLR